MATTFVWSGKTRQGVPQKGELQAETREDVIAQLRKQNIVADSIQPKAAKKGGPKGSVSQKDIVIFTRQFSTMIDAGLPLVQCLEILGAQTENKALAHAIQVVRGDVESGSTYADALRKHPKIFDDLYCNMVAAGEAGGILDTILNRLAKYIEKAVKLKSQVKSAMVYPAIIISVAVIVISALMIWVIPIFASMFSDFGGTLPLPTQIVMNISSFMKGNVIFIILGGVAAGWGIKRFYATDYGRRLIDHNALKVPVVGDLIRKAAVAKFTRTLGTLISSGVPILEGLMIVAKTAGNKTVESALLTCRTSISEGKTIADPLAQTKVFPAMVVQMIAVGESTGALDAMLSKIADFYDDEVDAAVGVLTSMLEPLLMVFLGTAIGFIVIAMYLPIFQMGSVVS